MSDTVELMSLQESILKEILLSKQCSAGKYLSPMQCVNTENNAIEYYITPIVTISKKKILIISKIIKGNWYDAIRNIDVIVKHIKSVYKIPEDTYTVILHAYLDTIALEKFYVIDVRDKYVINRLKIYEFENILN